jgi:hypothetical protein
MVDFENGSGNGTVPDRPGYLTTEFWLGLLAVVVSYLIAHHVAPEGSYVAQGLSIVATILAALGYTVSRTIVKRAKYAAIVEALKYKNRGK